MDDDWKKPENIAAAIKAQVKRNWKSGYVCLYQGCPYPGLTYSWPQMVAHLAAVHPKPQPKTRKPRQRQRSGAERTTDGIT